ncbi:DUF1453 domain-containing protein [Nonomuraea sp. NN258]|uniref:DUF1453 domain-containing protein n=1 Tax=Nonomuraea antri TaxID=2730852 RepID=UPI001567E3D9|nr:DUF1453 domain-containing protein [Nonomuraea antri]NRQ33053.1 DUF1453 domain-containing protein [Nonomuraea antri]
MDVLKIVLLVGLVCYVVARRIAGEPLAARDVYVAPIVLVALGVHGLTKVHLVPLDVVWLAVTLVVGVAFGALRAGTTVLFRKEGVLWQRYTWKTLVVWVVTAAISFGVGALAMAAGMQAEARSVSLSIGVGLAGEALVTLLRARASGVPFAPERR